ncbi:hypothetical protein, partial [Clostridium sp.]|uniref:hypothetical protein n=1 Tax=Clostridium sp. TaxID=1506 RepID=UPI002846D85F
DFGMTEEKVKDKLRYDRTYQDYLKQKKEEQKKINMVRAFLEAKMKKAHNKKELQDTMYVYEQLVKYFHETTRHIEIRMDEIEKTIQEQKLARERNLTEMQRQREEKDILAEEKYNEEVRKIEAHHAGRKVTIESKRARIAKLNSAQEKYHKELDDNQTAYNHQINYYENHHDSTLLEKEVHLSELNNRLEQLYEQVERDIIKLLQDNGFSEHKIISEIQKHSEGIAHPSFQSPKTKTVNVKPTHHKGEILPPPMFPAPEEKEEEAVAEPLEYPINISNNGRFKTINGWTSSELKQKIGETYRNEFKTVYGSRLDQMRANDEDLTKMFKFCKNKGLIK